MSANSYKNNYQEIITVKYLIDNLETTNMDHGIKVPSKTIIKLNKKTAMMGNENLQTNELRV